MHYFSQYLQPFIDHFGYPGLGIIIFLESVGLPLPAESLLIAAVLYCAGSNHLSINGIAITSIISAILGDSVGYFIGYKIASRSIMAFAEKIHIKPINFITLRYLFYKFGGVIVLFGRFFSIMRITVSLIAGSLKMPWINFLFFNVISAIIWGTIYSYGVYYGGLKAFSMNHYALAGIIVLVIIAIVIAVYISRHYFQYWTKKALEDLSKTEKESLGIDLEDFSND